MKQCTKCHTTKPLSDFHRDRNASDGRRSWCKVCINTNDRAKNSTGKVGAPPGRQMRERAWECLLDPTRMYEGRFPHIDFVGTLADGYWPEGSLWRGAPRRNESPTLWRIRDGRAVEEDGGRVLVTEGNHRPVLKVVRL